MGFQQPVPQPVSDFAGFLGLVTVGPQVSEDRKVTTPLLPGKRPTTKNVLRDDATQKNIATSKIQKHHIQDGPKGANSPKNTDDNCFSSCVLSNVVLRIVYPNNRGR